MEASPGKVREDRQWIFPCGKASCRRKYRRVPPSFFVDIVVVCTTILSMKKKMQAPKRRQGREPRPEKRAGTQESERKDRVLQARVPVSLYNNLVAQARRLRVPVSNLVRNILEDSTRMVENIVDGGIRLRKRSGKEWTLKRSCRSSAGSR